MKWFTQKPVNVFPDGLWIEHLGRNCNSRGRKMIGIGETKQLIKLNPTYWGESKNTKCLNKTFVWTKKNKVKILQNWWWQEKSERRNLSKHLGQLMVKCSGRFNNNLIMRGLDLRGLRKGCGWCCISFTRQIMHITHADISTLMFEGLKGWAKLVGWEWCMHIIYADNLKSPRLWQIFG